jgi:peptidylprolyl isomerase
MVQAKNGDTVKVHYTGRLSDGSIFDSSQGREPLEFVLGQGMMIAGFEEGILGMQLNESKTIQMPAEKGYGDSNPNLIFKVSRNDIPADIPLELGMTLSAHVGEDEEIPVIITAITLTDVTLDANHPLAGKELIFDVQIMEISSGASTIEKPFFFN